MKYQRCPICEGHGVVNHYFEHSNGAYTNRCPKCKGEMVIEEPGDVIQIPESATVRFYKHLMWGFAAAFFFLVFGFFILDYFNLLCVNT